MNRTEAKFVLDLANDPSKLKIVEAFVNGEQIQFFDKRIGQWSDCYNPAFHFVEFQYRIKPEKVNLYIATWSDQGKLQCVATENYDDVAKLSEEDFYNFKINVIEVDV